MDEQAHAALLWGPRKLWVSDEEKFRVNFKRIRTKAEKIGLNKSPFFPTTAAELAGLKAETLEAGVRKLRAKIEEKEKGLWAEKRLHGKTVFVVEPSGDIESRPSPVCHSTGVGKEVASTA
jgi:hypothetical protein